MDLKERQMGSSEQEVVLEALARTAGRPDCQFLEVGSWCGDSTLVLGQVARALGGHVFCVDWWKGNVGTELADIAATEDVFAAFWNRMKRAGLEDVVVPIRGPSAVVARVLAGGAFDLAFLDADHSYDGIRDDLRQYAPLVKPHGGILCGHDCEGRLADYDSAFLEAGKQVDFFESVHCGVVLAVGQSFRNYSIDHGIWSVRASAVGAWEPTNLTLPEIERRRQPPPSPIGYSKSYNLFRYGRLVYAVPYAQAEIDITDDADPKRSRLPSAPSIRELEQLLGEQVSAGSGPILLESYQGYNIIRHEERLFALAQKAGPLFLPQLSEVELRKLQETGACVIGDSMTEIKNSLDNLAPAQARVWKSLPVSVELCARQGVSDTVSEETIGCDLQLLGNDAHPHLVEEGYCGHNIIYCRGTWYGLGQDEGAFDEQKVQDGRYRRCVTGDSPEAVRIAIRRPGNLSQRLVQVAHKLVALARR